MGAPSPKAFNALYMLIGFGGIGLAVAICIIVDDKFWTYVSGYWGWQYVVYQDDCLLGWVSSAESSNLCSFNWAMASLGAFLFLLVFFLAMCNKRPGRSIPFVVTFFLLVACWATAAGINQAQIPQANDLAPGDDLNYWRNTIIGLSWGTFALSCLAFVASLVDVVKNKGQAPVEQPQFYAAAPGPVQYGGPPPPQGYGGPPQGYGAPPPPQPYGGGGGAPIPEYYHGPPAPGGYQAPPPPAAGGYQMPPPAYTGAPAGYPAAPQM